MERLENAAVFFNHPDLIREVVKGWEERIYAEYIKLILHVVCKRAFLNMEMLDVLIDKCGVDVNARALESPYSNIIDKIFEGPITLYYFIKAEYW